MLVFAQNYILKEVNKIIVNNSVKFYSKEWIYRNEVFHKPEAYRVHVINWHQRLRKELIEGNRLELRRHV